MVLQTTMEDQTPSENPGNVKNEPPKSKLSMMDACKQCICYAKSLRIEPVVFFMAVTFGAYLVAFIPFIYAKNCMKLYPNLAGLCSNLSALSADLQNRIEQETSTFMEIIKVCYTLPAIFTALFLAAYSDKHGRKFPLLIGILGFVQSFIFLLFTSGLRESSVYALVPGSLLFGLSGHLLTLFSGCFATVTDQEKDPKTLTIRIGVISGLGAFGLFTGSLITGQLVASYGYTSVFLFGTVTTSAVFIYTVLCVPDSKPEHVPNATNEPQAAEQGIWRHGINECCQIVGVFFKERPHQKHKFLWFVFAIVLYDMVFTTGSNDLIVLYTKLSPLNWDTQEYSVLVAVTNIVSAASMPLGTVLFKKVLKREDTLLLVVACIVSMFSKILQGMSRTSWMILLAGFLSGLSGISFPGYRAIISKLVQHEENARIFAMLSAVELLAPLVSTIIYNNVYNVTIALYPGMVFEIAAFLILPTLIASFVLHRLMLRNKLTLEADSLIAQENC